MIHMRRAGWWLVYWCGGLEWNRVISRSWGHRSWSRIGGFWRMIGFWWVMCGLRRFVRFWWVMGRLRRMIDWLRRMVNIRS